METKSCLQQVCELINAANPDMKYKLTETDVSQGTSVPVDDSETHNFIISLAANDTSKYFTGSSTYRYTRLELDLGTVEKTVEDADWDNPEDILRMVNIELQKIHPGDVFTAEHDLSYGLVRFDSAPNPDDVEKTNYTVMLGIPHPKFYVKGTLGNNAAMATTPVLTFVVSPAAIEKIDLSTTNGELDGFTA